MSRQAFIHGRNALLLLFGGLLIPFSCLGRNPGGGLTFWWYLSFFFTLFVIFTNVFMEKPKKRHYAWCLLSTVLALTILFSLSGVRESYLVWRYSAGTWSEEFAW